MHQVLGRVDFWTVDNFQILTASVRQMGYYTSLMFRDCTGVDIIFFETTAVQLRFYATYEVFREYGGSTHNTPAAISRLLAINTLNTRLASILSTSHLPYHHNH